MRSRDLIRYSFAVYLLLVLFDGVLRKWLLPSLSSPILVARDLVAIPTIAYALWQRRFAWNWFVVATVCCTVLAFASAVTIAHGSIPVGLYGARIYLFHLPLIFVYAEALTPDDLERFKKLFLYLALPSLAIAMWQFYSPQSAWINRGVGGDMEGSGFSGGALGRFRPAGLYAFTAANVEFWSVAACVVVSCWLEERKRNRLLMATATLAILGAAPILVSRTYILQLGIISAFAFSTVVLKPAYLRGVLVAAAGLTVVLALLLQFEFFQGAIDVMATRFTLASEAEGTIGTTVVDRVFGGKALAFVNQFDLPFYGAGLGAASNFGSLQLTGQIQYLYGEEEWVRITSEFGLALGIVIISLRVLLSCVLLWRGFLAIRRGKPFPWILMSFGFLFIASAILSTPATLGTCVVIATVVCAALMHAPSEPSRAIR